MWYLSILRRRVYSLHRGIQVLKSRDKARSKYHTNCNFVYLSFVEKNNRFPRRNEYEFARHYFMNIKKA